MSPQYEGFTDEAATPRASTSVNLDAPFRRDLAFPRLTEMLERLRSYSQEELFTEDTLLYTYGDRDTDTFVILSGELKAGSLWKEATRNASDPCLRVNSPVS